MYIVHIATEFAPVAKVGGLADVLHGLSKELQREGHTVEVILPKYDCLHFGELNDLKMELRELWSEEGPHRYNNTIWSAHVDGITLILIEPHHPDYYFSRDVIYGCPDDIDRFTYFSRTALEYLCKTNKVPDVLHVHDWPTAVIPLLHKECYVPRGYPRVGTLLTIHNMEHQGKCQPLHLARIGLPSERYLEEEKMQDPYNPTLVNLLKGGIVYADAINTVSPTYKEEILTAEGGCGLQATLHKYRSKLTGILNGIDKAFWNPENDPHLIKQYQTHHLKTAEEIDAILKAKRENKRHLRMHLDLKEEDKPLVASVTRLVQQKAPLLIKHALLHTVEKGGQFVLLGASAGSTILREFEELQQRLVHSDQARILLDKDEALAHLIFAAADLFIIPSLFEPCGLTQLIALRYGAIPVARRTGGLADTVFDVDTSLHPSEERNGFTFDFADEQGVDWALDRALTCYSRDPERWRILVAQGARRDHNWKEAAKQYVALYIRIKQ